jgi:hypothetical protein
MRESNFHPSTSNFPTRQPYNFATDTALRVVRGKIAAFRQNKIRTEGKREEMALTCEWNKE